MSFQELGLPEALTRALQDAGYTAPTEVQAQAVPAALAGRDLMVSSATGSGKTASFVLPALNRVLAARGDNSKRREKGVVHGPRVLVLVPTRELALQVTKAFANYGRHVQGLRLLSVVGGVPYGAQLKALRAPLDVLIATPGRLMDHMSTGKAVLANVELLVLDEADRMLDMGFIEDIHHIAEALPAGRQSLMTSATFAGPVGHLAVELMREPQRIEVASHTQAHADIEQRLHWADDLDHKNALLDSILTERSVDQAVVFTSTQRDADWLAERLGDMGHAVAALHGGMPQGRRNRVLEGLRRRQLRVLVATDVAARGIDVPTISHVINYGLPMKAEDYVHRIGRTGRAGRSGLAVTLAERRDVGMIQRIQRFTTQRIPSATIEGLEPKRPEPEMRPAGRGPGGPGRPGHGPRRFGGPGGGFDRGSRFDGGDRGPRGPRPERGDRPFGDRPFADRPFGDRPFGDRPQGGHARQGAPHDPRWRDAGEGRASFEPGDRGQGRPFHNGPKPRHDGSQARPFNDGGRAPHERREHHHGGADHGPRGDRGEGRGFAGPRGPRPFGDDRPRHGGKPPMRQRPR